MSQPILSICIPTYNSSKVLLETLESIVSQFDNTDIANQVEVIISDNASTDDTMAVVSMYQEKYSNIHYFRNDSNLGPSINIIRVTEYANGEYLWLLTDNDCSSSFALGYILRIIHETQFDIMLGNFDSADQEKLHLFHEEYTGYTLISGSKELSTFFIDKGGMNFHDFGSNFSLYSIFFVKKAYFSFSRALLDAKKLGTHLFPHSYIIYANIENALIVKPNNIFTLAMGHPSSWKHSLKIYTDFADVFYAMLHSKNITPQFKSKIRGFLIRYFIFNFIALSVNRMPGCKRFLKNIIDNSIIMKWLSEKIINPTV